MNGLPWHPIVVHLPLVLALLAPIVSFGVLAGRLKGPLQRRSWWFAVALSAALAVGSFTALKTGEADEENVEEIVGDTPMGRHEEAGELFMWSSVALLVLLLPVPLLRSGKAERTVAALAVAGGIVVAALAIRVGHTGGEIVYRYGGAAAHAGLGVVSEERTMRFEARERHDDHDEH